MSTVQEELQSVPFKLLCVYMFVYTIFKQYKCHFPHCKCIPTNLLKCRFFSGCKCNDSCTQDLLEAQRKEMHTKNNVSLAMVADTLVKYEY